MQTTEQSALLQLLGITLLQCQQQSIFTEVTEVADVVQAAVQADSHQHADNHLQVSGPSAPPNSRPVNICEDAPLAVPPSPLQQDVVHALAQLGLTASWHYQAGVAWQLRADGLFTEPLERFADGNAKRALWQLLCQYAPAEVPADFSVAAPD